MKITAVLKITTGHNSIKNVGGVVFLFYCALSDDALYLYQILTVFNTYKVIE